MVVVDGNRARHSLEDKPRFAFGIEIAEEAIHHRNIFFEQILQAARKAPLEIAGGDVVATVGNACGDPLMGCGHRRQGQIDPALAGARGLAAGQGKPQPHRPHNKTPTPFWRGCEVAPRVGFEPTTN